MNADRGVQYVWLKSADETNVPVKKNLCPHEDENLLWELLKFWGAFYDKIEAHYISEIKNHRNL